MIYALLSVAAIAVGLGASAAALGIALGNAKSNFAQAKAQREQQHLLLVAEQEKTKELEYQLTASRIKSQSLEAYLRNEIAGLDKSLAECAAPDAIRERINRLLTGAK